MDHIKKLKSKDLKVLLHYYSRTEKLKASPKKVELVEAVTELFRKFYAGFFEEVDGWEVLCYCK